MKKKIRRGVFESNSSSTHSLVMCSEKKFESWKNGELLLNEWEKEFISVNNLSDKDKLDAANEYEESKNEFQKDWKDLSDEAKQHYYVVYAEKNGLIDDGKTYEQYMNDTYLETFINTYTTESGDKVIAFGKYGFDG